VFRHFPLTEIHPLAGTAAESAELAGAHGRFWEMHDGIFENQDRLGLPFLFAAAEALGLSQEDLRDALASHVYAPKVQSDFLGGVRSGVNGTPSFFINGLRHDAPFDPRRRHRCLALARPDRGLRLASAGPPDLRSFVERVVDSGVCAGRLSHDPGGLSQRT
jgi:hypothetical protein